MSIADLSLLVVAVWLIAVAGYALLRARDGGSDPAAPEPPAHHAHHRAGRAPNRYPGPRALPLRAGVTKRAPLSRPGPTDTGVVALSRFVRASRKAHH
jgi:hypothetical protein